MVKFRFKLRQLLDNLTPGSKRAKLGGLVAELIDNHNNLVAKHNELLVKLDADAGVTDEDYEATVAATAVTALDDR